ncbi:hypothetical protein B4N89_16735 [Embleya scabrispora]|uniref:Uncharacterized protein n=1 Tax=Embleya scabrispora TaxID=159449 RepID=A0A1T3NZV3_9ACTN|nr:hypothetical protein B4N89_16735 [Embleya scabrispora]
MLGEAGVRPAMTRPAGLGPRATVPGGGGLVGLGAGVGRPVVDRALGSGRRPFGVSVRVDGPVWPEVGGLRVGGLAGWPFFGFVFAMGIGIGIAVGGGGRDSVGLERS